MLDRIGCGATGILMMVFAGYVMWRILRAPIKPAKVPVYEGDGGAGALYGVLLLGLTGFVFFIGSIAV